MLDQKQDHEVINKMNENHMSSTCTLDRAASSTPSSQGVFVNRPENPVAPCDEVAEMERRLRDNDSPLYSREHREMYDFPLLHWCKNQKVLEVGAGYGYGLNRIAEVADEVVAVDVLQKNLAYCAEHYDLANVRYELADICTWSGLDESFDVAVMIDVIEHIPDDVLALRNVHRMLRPRGMLFVSTVWPNIADDGVPYNRCHCREYFPREIHNMLSSVFPHTIIHAHDDRNLIIMAQKEY